MTDKKQREEIKEKVVAPILCELLQTCAGRRGVPQYHSAAEVVSSDVGVRTVSTSMDSDTLMDELKAVAALQDSPDMKALEIDVIAGRTPFIPALRQEIMEGSTIMSLMFNSVKQRKGIMEEQDRDTRQGRALSLVGLMESMAKLRNTKFVGVLASYSGVWLLSQRVHNSVFEFLNHMGVTCSKRHAQDLLEGAVARRLQVTTDGRTGIFIGLDNCGYKLTRHFSSKTNKNEYMNTVNHVAAVLEGCPPSSSRVYLPTREWKDTRQFILEMLPPSDGAKENEICQSCWDQLMAIVRSGKDVGVPPAAQDAPKVRYDILDPVNLSDGRPSTSLGTTSNLDGLFTDYKARADAKDQPVLFVFGDEQVFESGWKLRREQPEK